MRTTLRIDDNLLSELRKRAETQKVSLTKLVNQMLRQALARKPAVYREKVYSMGRATVNLDKALAIAAANEDVEVARKLSAHK